MAETSFPQRRFVGPPGSTNVFLVRHGASEPFSGEPFPLLDGTGDPGLAPEGFEQAERVADRLADEGIEALYVTTLCRTQQTAAPLAERLGIDPIVVPDLREVNLGEWEGGMMRRHVAEGHPLVARLFTEQRWDVIPGAEPHDAFAARVRRGLEQVIGDHPGRRVAVFTHGGVIGELVRQAAEATRGFAFAASDNGPISHLAAFGDRWLIRRFNDTSHHPGGLDLPDPDEVGVAPGP